MENMLRVCTWNLKLGLQLPVILSSICRENDFKGLDMLALQEVSVHEKTPDAAVIAELLGKDYNYFQRSTHVLMGREQGNALVWNTKRFSVVNKSSFFLPKAHEGTFAKAEKVLLRLIPKQQRNSLVVEGRIGKKSLRVYVAHLDVMGFGHRRFQLETILNDSKRRIPSDSTIIAGDFNTFKYFRRPSWKSFDEDAEKAGFKDVTSDIVWTQKALRMKQKLDAIFVNPPTVSYNSWALQAQGSDHIPVFANIGLLC